MEVETTRSQSRSWFFFKNFLVLQKKSIPQFSGVKWKAWWNIQVLEVATRELSVGDNDNLTLTLLGDGNNVLEVADTALNLDLVVEELLEGSDIEDLIGSRLAAVDDELLGDLRLLSALGVLL